MKMLIIFICQKVKQQIYDVSLRRNYDAAQMSDTTMQRGQYPAAGTARACLTSITGMQRLHRLTTHLVYDRHLTLCATCRVPESCPALTTSRRLALIDGRGVALGCYWVDTGTTPYAVSIESPGSVVVVVSRPADRLHWRRVYVIQPT